MAARTSNQPLLVRWHAVVGDAYAVQLDERAQVTGRFQTKAGLPSQPDGAYAQYPEGLFALFATGPDIWVQWQTRQVQLLDNHVVDWQRGIGGRHFALRRNAETDLKFTYQGFGQYLHRPWRLFADLLMPDDDWGLVADLPSFLHSHFKDRTKLAELIRTQATTAE